MVLPGTAAVSGMAPPRAGRCLRPPLDTAWGKQQAWGEAQASRAEEKYTSFGWQAAASVTAHVSSL